MNYLRVRNGRWYETCSFRNRGSVRRILMTSKILLRCALILFVVGVFTATLAAQSVELYPNAGGFFPSRIDNWGNNKFKAEGLYGLKAGVFVTQNAELEGSFGYINHFEMAHSPNSDNIN